MRALLIHGCGGSPDGGWFMWLRRELEKRGVGVIAPQFPSPENQSPRAWDDMLEAIDVKIEPDTIIVAHSLGPLFALHLAQHHKIKAAFLVAPFLREIGIEGFDVVNAPFFQEFDFGRIRQNLGNAVIYASDNDPYVAQELSKEFCEKIGARFVLVPGAGHFNGEEFYAGFPQLLKDIVPFLNK